MMTRSRSEPLYPIGIVAKMVDCHPQTLRLYERHGLLEPSRSEGNVRLYSDADVELIQQIQTLTQDMGINLAGVDLVLRMREQMEEMTRQHQSALEQTRREIEERFTDVIRRMEVELQVLREELAVRRREEAIVRIRRGLPEGNQ